MYTHCRWILLSDYWDSTHICTTLLHASGNPYHVPDRLASRTAHSVIFVAPTDKTAPEATRQYSQRKRRFYVSAPQVLLVRVALVESSG